MIKNSRDIKLNVQPLFITLHHDYVFEGPCRFGPPEHLTEEYDNMMNAERVKKLGDEISREMGKLGAQVCLREPIWVDRSEEFQVTDEMIDALSKDSDEVDVYLIGELSRMVDVLIPFAQRVKKPLVSAPAPSRPMHTILPAAMLSRGLEFYTHRTWEETLQLFRVLRMRKVLRESRVLCAARFGTTRTVSAMDNFVDLERVTQVLGTHFCFINPHELMDQSHIADCTSNPTTPGRRGLNPTEEDVAEINALTDELMNGALECHMSREDVFSSVRAFVTVKKFIDHYGCSGFTAPCPDMCATRRYNQERYTFCLTHSLLGEMGIPSACEYDIAAVVSMLILSGFVDAPAYMGNTTHSPLEWKLKGSLQMGARTVDSDESAYKERVLAHDPENIIFSFHSVAKRNMKGFHTDKGQYALRPFTFSGFGVTLRYDFTQDAGTPVTMCRIDPACRKIFVARGSVVAGKGYDENGCTLGVFIKVADGQDYFNKQIMFGNHIPLVYGDCFDEVRRLGEILGLEVVTA